MGSKGYAQTGALTVDATASPCDVIVTMYAIAPCITSACGDLKSVSFPVTAGTTANWTNFGAFCAFGSPCWAIATYGLPPAACTNFQWACVKLSFAACPGIWGCTPADFDMGDDTIGCTSTSDVGSNSCSGHTVSGTWSPTSGSALDNVVITVY